MASPSIARAERARFTVGERARIGWRLALLLIALAAALVLHFLWRLVRLPSPWPRLLLGACARIAGARVEKRGRPLRRDVFYVANHISWIDILAIAGATGSAFIAKAELRRAPLVGWLATLNRTVFVRREDRLGVADQVARVRDALAGGWPITVFPEGTTGDGRTLLPFKTAMLSVLEPPPPGVRVQPLLVDYGPATPDIAWVGEESGAANALRILARPGSFSLRLHFLDPLDPAAFGNRKALAAECRRRMEEAMGGEAGRTRQAPASSRRNRPAPAPSSGGEG